MAERTERVITTETEPTTTANAATTRTEVVETSNQGSTVAGRVIKLVAGVIIGLLIVRFALLALNANQATDFVNFVLNVTGPLVAPFNGIFGNPSDTVRIEPQTLTAIVVYGLVAWALVYVTRIKRPRTA